jgi:hypothetical protein
MTPIEVLGLLSLGALTVLVAIGCVGAYLCRGHKIDLTSIRVVSTRPVVTFAEPKPYTGRAELEWTDAEGKRQRRPFRVGKDGIVEGSATRQATTADFYDLAHGRGEDDQR